MKKTFAYALLSLMVVLAVACGTKKETAIETNADTEATATKEVWKEMDEFHTVMADSFHPYKDSADLAPAKAKAADMAAAAEKWHNAPLPAKVNNDDVKSKLAQLHNDTKTFAETVKTADDKTIAEALTKLHDQFHGLQEAWYGGHGEHEHHE